MRAPPPLRWHYVLRCAGAQRSQEQSSLACLKASFQTRLRSIICAEGRYATPSQERKISPARAKTKNKECPKGHSLFLAEQERFELSRRYSRPTPLAGAPLHHLSTTPHQLHILLFRNRAPPVVCHSIIASFGAFVKGFGDIFYLIIKHRYKKGV